MKISMLISSLLVALSLAACDRPTVVNNPVTPVAVPVAVLVGPAVVGVGPVMGTVTLLLWEQDASSAAVVRARATASGLRGVVIFVTVRILGCLF